MNAESGTADSVTEGLTDVASARLALVERLQEDGVLTHPRLRDALSLLDRETLDGFDRPTLLDLGSGTGQVPAALLPAVPRVTRLDLVDRDSDMLRTAAEQLRPLHGQAAVAFHAVPAEASSAPVDGYKADLVTCARAFHWLDRPAVLRTVDRVTGPTAAVAVMGDGSLWTYGAHWIAALKALIQSYLGDGRRAGTTGTYTEPSSHYEDDLAESAFSKVTEYRFPVRRTWTPDQVVGCLRSTSFAHPASFDEPDTPPEQAGRHARFEREAHALLEEYVHGEGLVEDAVFTVLLARRGGAV
ncbi:class I SAM-dependent methyltransferase [Streptomyces sp. NPDC006510]|uniref:class I SAM-dependent methyltransferase n=1 Tax=Streptomyces sp. NPDC006510 TaxID=3155600 RepID=UPI0033B53FB2